MSWQATNYVKNLSACPDDARLSPSQKCLLFVLADYHNTAHRAVWPSIPSLAEEALLSKSQVYRALAYFEKHGLLVRSNRGGGRGVTVAYEFPQLDSPPELKGSNMTPFSVSQKGAKTVAKGCHLGAPNKEKTEPEPEHPSPLPPSPARGGGTRAPTKRELREIERRREATVGTNRPCPDCGQPYFSVCTNCEAKKHPPAMEASSG